MTYSLLACLFLIPNSGYLLSGQIYGQLSSLLQGSYSADQMASALRDDCPAVQVYHALSRLDRIGLLTIVADPPLITVSPSVDYGDVSKEARAFWHSLGAEDDIAQKLKSAAVAIAPIHVSDASSELLQAALEKLGIRVVSELEAAFVIAITDHYLQPALTALAQRMQQSGQTWTVVKPRGRTLWLGPIIQPHSQSCWTCLRYRLCSNRAIDHAFQAVFGHLPDHSQASLGITQALAINLIALELAKWLVLGRSHCLEKQILTLDLLTLETQFHPLPQRPQCPNCGTSDDPSVENVQPSHAPLPLLNRPKLFNTDGGYRTCERESTLARLKPLISPITGIIPGIEKVAEGFPVFLAKQTYPLSENQGFWQALSREGAAGKGMTDTQASVSCIAEAVERYSACWQGDEPRLTASYRDVADRAIHPNDLLLFSQRQIEQRQTWNQQHSPHLWVPVAFDETVAIAWTPCWSLSQQVSRLMPTAYCYLNTFLPSEQQFVIADSNGCAAGNTLEEAILQGFLELVERDAVALWWFNRVQRPAISLETFDQPLLLDIVAQYQRLERHLVLLDITSDLTIPVVAAVSWQADGKGIRVGLGAHLEAGIAVSRAITELNQLIAQEEALIRSHQDLYQGNQELEHWSKVISIDQQAYLTPLDNRLKTAADFPSSRNTDLLDDIHTCLNRAADCGIEVLVLNLTRKDIDFPTVRVIAPGLRHFKPRFAPGRLYEVPVALNWIEQRLAEADLNPWPFCF